MKKRELKELEKNLRERRDALMCFKLLLIVPWRKTAPRCS